MLKLSILLTAVVFLAGCYEDTVVERRDYGRRRHVSYVSDRPYSNDEYYRDRHPYYEEDRPTVYRVDHGRDYDQPAPRRRVTVGF